MGSPRAPATQARLGIPAASGASSGVQDLRRRALGVGGLAQHLEHREVRDPWRPVRRRCTGTLHLSLRSLEYFARLAELWHYLNVSFQSLRHVVIQGGRDETAIGMIDQARHVLRMLAIRRARPAAVRLPLLMRAPAPAEVAKFNWP